jgi:hypothetical protein
MALPEFNEFGDLPEGNHRATLAEVVARFGTVPPSERLLLTASDGSTC